MSHSTAEGNGDSDDDVTTERDGGPVLSVNTDDIITADDRPGQRRPACQTTEKTD